MGAGDGGGGYVLAQGGRRAGPRGAAAGRRELAARLSQLGGGLSVARRPPPPEGTVAEGRGGSAARTAVEEWRRLRQGVGEAEEARGRAGWVPVRRQRGKALSPLSRAFWTSASSSRVRGRLASAKACPACSASSISIPRIPRPSCRPPGLRASALRTVASFDTWRIEDGFTQKDVDCEASLAHAAESTFKLPPMCSCSHACWLGWSSGHACIMPHPQTREAAQTPTRLGLSFGSVLPF